MPMELKSASPTQLSLLLVGLVSLCLGCADVPSITQSDLHELHLRMSLPPYIPMIVFPPDDLRWHPQEISVIKIARD